jgi:hypothetical protein
MVGDSHLGKEAGTTVTWKVEIVYVIILEGRELIPDQGTRSAVGKEGWL